jgi:predicted nucleic acid-binding protein
MENKVWFIDSNVIVNWVLGSGGLLKQLCDNFDLSDDFFHIFFERYKISNTFIEKLITSKQGNFPKDRFYISLFALNELFSGIRNEVNSIILFKEGVPLSKWLDKIPSIQREDEGFIYIETMKKFDILFGNKKISLIQDQNPEREWDFYLSIYSEILFSNKYIKTQDTTLLVTAILNGADYFVTSDKRLIEDVSNLTEKEFKLSLITPESASEILDNRFH